MKTTALPARTGKLISFEGIDGAGKSTHIGWFADRLREKLGLASRVVVTREPGGTPLGEALRDLLLHSPMHIETETLLMFAARREHIAMVIGPALHRGDWVVTDRFTDATFAYQGGGRGVAMDKLALLEQWVHAGLQPDLTLLFDLPAKTALLRLADSRIADNFERQTETFFDGVRTEYLRRVEEAPSRFIVIDGAGTTAAVANELERILNNLLQINCVDS